MRAWSRRDRPATSRSRHRLIPAGLAAVAALCACAGGDDGASPADSTAPPSAASVTAAASTPPVSTSTEPPPTMSTSAPRPPVTAVPATTTPSTDPGGPDLGDRPPIDDSLGVQVPPVSGFETVQDSEIRWEYYRLPDDVEAYSAAIGQSGSQIGIVIVARADDNRSLIHEFADTAFEDSFQLVTSTAQSDEGEFVVTNGAPVAVATIGDVPVILAALPADDAALWAWSHDDLLWLVRGTMAAEAYVEAITDAQQQAAPADPYDYLGLEGDLYESCPISVTTRTWMCRER